MNELTIATRTSQLALWQAHEVKRQLEEYFPNMKIHVKPIKTQGDKILDKSLKKVGGKGLFIKELELALLNGEADIAVHSLKDVPHTLGKEFCLPAIMQRQDPRDAFISLKINSLNDLQDYHVLGSSSLRRIDQITEVYPCQVKSIRGNINTRLEKLSTGEFDALILATVGLQRLELDSVIKEYIPIEISIPSPGQGALGIEILLKKLQLFSPILNKLNDKISQIECSAERKFFRIINGNCQKSAACFVRLNSEKNVYITHYFYKSQDKAYRGSFVANSTEKLSDLIENHAKKAEKILNKIN